MHRDQAKKILNIFLDLVSSIKNQESCVPNLPLDNFSLPYSSFHRDGSIYRLRGYYNHQKMEDCVEQLWGINTEIRQTLSSKSIKDKVVKLIFQYQEDESSITPDSFKKVLDELLKIPKQNFLVLCSVYGSSLGGNNSSELGPFTLYTWDAYQALVNTNPKNVSILDSLLKEHNERKKLDESYPSDFPMLEDLGRIFISVQVLARDRQKALELAAQRFNQFENVVSYMLGYEAKRFNFGVISSSSLSLVESLLISSEGISYSSLFQDNVFPLQLDSPFFFDGKIRLNETDYNQYWKDYGHSWIWETLKHESSQLSDWHKRILSSIEWIGRGLRDKNPAKSLVQFTFALEALFSYKEKGVLVSPSIASTLSEFTALIVADNLSDRLDVIKKVNEIYKKRSAVAHGGTQSVPASIVSEAMNLMRDLIAKIITNPGLRELQSIEKVKEWVNDKKYS
jgi:hypothetical protein